MKNIAQNISDLVGKTPLLQLNNIAKQFNLKANLFAKLEYFNPAGSSKDRIAKFMIEEALKTGKLTKDSIIIEPTSGNTGIGLAAIASSYGIKVILTMPENMSEERIKLLKMYGAQIVLTDKTKGMAGAIEKANELAKENPGSFIPSQFDNPVNPLTHQKTTGPEIWQDLDGNVDAYVACIGTGGTLSGTGRFLKQQNPQIKIVGVEPASSPLITKGIAGPHKIQGIGANFIPQNYDSSIVDQIICVQDDDAFEYAKLIAKTEGAFVGISSGAALCAAIQLAQQPEFENKNIVVLLPDSGARYLSVF
ncbi:MAG: cysteine synthase A [Treponema sp.]|jgi:cysteine synthase A|nr:cysteine synthase A [Treponema sp.]